jgi:DhnA family fructose-bisphosphate aldolase class Ia
MKTLLSSLLATLALTAWAAGDDVPAQIAQERERLQRERQVIEQAHELRMRECWQRFVVNACLQEVRRSRHAALAPIRAQELELNAQDRAWRSQQRDERLQDKQRARERQP